MTKDFWNERYSQAEFAYGEKPNEYLKDKLSTLQAGAILFPAEGEGRNAVYAAQLGWKVSAFDTSSEGKNKAVKLAQKHQVQIDYRVGDLSSLHYANEQFDAIALIYAHFAAPLKSVYHQHFSNYLKKGGLIILEAFSKKHLEYIAKNEKVGGPKDLAMLYSMEEIKADFENFEILELTETEVELHEGLYHNGLGSVIRFVGKKK